MRVRRVYVTAIAATRLHMRSDWLDASNVQFLRFNISSLTDYYDVSDCWMHFVYAFPLSLDQICMEYRV